MQNNQLLTKSRVELEEYSLYIQKTGHNIVELY